MPIEIPKLQRQRVAPGAPNRLRARPTVAGQGEQAVGRAVSQAAGQITDATIGLLKRQENVRQSNLKARAAALDAARAQEMKAKLYEAETQLLQIRGAAGGRFEEAKGFDARKAANDLQGWIKHTAEEKILAELPPAVREQFRQQIDREAVMWRNSVNKAVASREDAAINSAFEGASVASEQAAVSDALLIYQSGGDVQDVMEHLDRMYSSLFQMADAKFNSDGESPRLAENFKVTKFTKNNIAIMENLLESGKLREAITFFNVARKGKWSSEAIYQESGIQQKLQDAQRKVFIDDETFDLFTAAEEKFGKNRQLIGIEVLSEINKRAKAGAYNLDEVLEMRKNWNTWKEQEQNLDRISDEQLIGRAEQAISNQIGLKSLRNSWFYKKATEYGKGRMEARWRAQRDDSAAMQQQKLQNALAILDGMMLDGHRLGYDKVNVYLPGQPWTEGLNQESMQALFAAQENYRTQSRNFRGQAPQAVKDQLGNLMGTLPVFSKNKNENERRRNAFQSKMMDAWFQFKDKNPEATTWPLEDMNAAWIAASRDVTVSVNGQDKTMVLAATLPEELPFLYETEEQYQLYEERLRAAGLDPVKVMAEQLKESALTEDPGIPYFGSRSRPGLVPDVPSALPAPSEDPRSQQIPPGVRGNIYRTLRKVFKREPTREEMGKYIQFWIDRNVQANVERDVTVDDFDADLLREERLRKQGGDLRDLPQPEPEVE